MVLETSVSTLYIGGDDNDISLSMFDNARKHNSIRTVEIELKKNIVTCTI